MLILLPSGKMFCYFLTLLQGTEVSKSQGEGERLRVGIFKNRDLQKLRVGHWVESCFDTI